MPGPVLTETTGYVLQEDGTSRVLTEGIYAVGSSLAGRGVQSLPTFAQMIGRNDSPYLANRSGKQAGATTQRMDHDLSLALARRAWPTPVSAGTGSARPTTGQIYPRGNP